MQNSLNVQISESLLNLQGFFVESIEKVIVNKQNQIQVSIRKLGSAYCPRCNKRTKIHDKRIRYLKHSAILLTPIVLKLTLRRTKCSQCGILTEEQLIVNRSLNWYTFGSRN